MNIIKFTTNDFKETFDGFIFTAECEGAEERKFAVEALQADGSYLEAPVIITAKEHTVEIHVNTIPFEGRIIYT